MTINNLFVYGTLMQGQSRNYVLKGLTFETAILKGYEKQEPTSLGFPLIIRKEDSIVEGEIYFNIPDSLLKKIDIIEGEGDLYHRIIVKVVNVKGEHIESFVYYPSNTLQESLSS